MFLETEKEILNRAIDRIQIKLGEFETRYGAFDRESLYGKVDDMELLEREGELETLVRLREKLESLKEPSAK